MNDVEKIVELEGKITELEKWKEDSTQAMFKLFKITETIVDSFRGYIEARVEEPEDEE